MKEKLRKLTLTALLIAMCVVGANIKILGSIALDSFPGMLGAIFLGPVAGAGIGFIGHLLSALFAGFPSSLPVHIVIASMMAVCLYVYGWLRRRFSQRPLLAVVLSTLAAYFINVPLCLGLLYPVLKQLVFVLFWPLSLAAVANLALAEMLDILLPKSLKEKMLIKSE